MTYFQDLTKYTYGNSAAVRPGTRNVGWLGENREFPAAAADDELLQILWEQCKVSITQTRGLYECHMCQSPEANIAERNGEKLLLGSAEIRVLSNTGEIFAAPNLIYHYVAVHQYRPPAQFVSALKSGPRPPDVRYFDRLRELGWSWRSTLVPEENQVRTRFIRSKNEDALNKK